MDEAAAEAAGSGTPDLMAVSRALEALRLAWGDVYMLGHDEKGYWAARPDRVEEVRLAVGTGNLFTRHERTGVVLRARRGRDGRVR